MSSESWPPKLKEWVAKCLGQMGETNKQEAQAELRKVISDAYNSNTLWTTDWAAMELGSLKPKPIIAPVSLGKRKMQDNFGQSKKAKKAAKQTAYTTPSGDFNDQAALNRRAQRFQREHDLEKQRLQSNGITFNNKPHLNHSWTRTNTPQTEDELDWDRFTIVGTNEEIFKEYLRLTSASEPKPEQIRPLRVLRKSLDQLIDRWKNRAPYSWICSQFKSLRQDLTVQRVRNDFTVRVYEVHARMALESNDMVEYNACQATLKVLYEDKIPGNVEEFTAYRILMLLHGRNRSEMNLYVGQLTSAQKAAAPVQHALAVQRALSMGNYHRFFILYVDAPNMGAYIMDHFISRERARALLVISKAYMTIPLEFLCEELAFESYEEATEFLSSHSSAFYKNPNAPDAEKIVDCREAHGYLAQIVEEKYRKVGIKGMV
ncbi:hypothetical protein FISHEDRAFT_63536 [Fistulina hepatica ATCC 64428]|uniref:PCI domain-containing protein n=1 Tax=Fistulina hepatica ATCC 64428 TaxID=1128425 RepID=A0A0D7ANF1_9AGAR|nr:hypothetical protein FISHEDRAFT_63536 [Fistulina hepatica ATCC 64428]